MSLLLAIAAIFKHLNDLLLRVGRAIGVVAVAAMVVAILIQVFFRYILNNALPWPDEAARFCMLWMTGLMAPTAFRNGGFVAIDVIDSMLSSKTQPPQLSTQPPANTEPTAPQPVSKEFPEEPDKHPARNSYLP